MISLIGSESSLAPSNISIVLHTFMSGCQLPHSDLVLYVLRTFSNVEPTVTNVLTMRSFESDCLNVDTFTPFLLAVSVH
jgi:hypothetical protein